MPAAAAKSLQSCLTLCDPTDSSPPGSSVPGILQARTLEWVAISSSDAWKWKLKVKSLSCVQLLATPWTVAHQAPPPWDSPGKNTGVGCHFLLQCMKVKIESEVAQLCLTLSDPYLLKSVCRSKSNSKKQTWNNWLVQNWGRNMTRLYIVTLLI